MRLPLYLVVSIAGIQAYGGHITLFRRGDCQPSLANEGGSVLEISAENEIWCAPIDDVFQSAVSYYNTGLPCEFRLYNSHVCSLDSLSHTIRTENPTGKCLSATGSSGRYMAVTALCGPSFPGGTKRKLINEAREGEQHVLSSEALTNEETTSDIDKRAGFEWWHRLTNYLGQRFVRLRPNRPVMNDYAETHHILTTHTAELPTAILTPTAAMTIAQQIVNDNWGNTGWAAYPIHRVGTHIIYVDFLGQRVHRADGSFFRVPLWRLVQELQTDRIHQMLMDGFMTMRLSGRNTYSAEFKFLYGDEVSLIIEIHVE
ncbi:hypothetical protein ASPACDRAFT_64109 [Aspergillus aculeatus ATCC 16872]|uniref:Uncharacterized protein n=1 Tax=Aspergillus aculeatus (strain ATCC 16872 / CBS 172.66 / WB 5094) TaxID=690307 RepID=A0A1L9WHH3_ASPA1|nr:uncharacterized protein ASPACDRAFT_64109 [Aspergillus aculeatus ATCC 16872]OJJ95618.1 hypothetical protein ASPACDRAFT_64109 [Aspergillus aculeatus ATCC 16872]